MTGIMGLYIKEMYGKDPHFKETKVVYSLYNDSYKENWDKRFAEKLKFEGFEDSVCEKFKDTSFLNYSKNMLQFFDGVNISSEDLNADLKGIYDELSSHKLDFVEEEHMAKELSEFYDKVIQETALA